MVVISNIWYVFITFSVSSFCTQFDLLPIFPIPSAYHLHYFAGLHSLSWSEKKRSRYREGISFLSLYLFDKQVKRIILDVSSLYDMFTQLIGKTLLYLTKY